ncbi:hypothetical protein CKM354_000930600 [Cercospora kikuchii]|uniref:Uncharacterized protein n=1 Tax=Cercospora kikuchii TaxID=84275 RepID=A0A9P3CXB9_9PEZI|nr:uncharacterized protein CKM354_000930600 [Cercospora kikuchii]GIZ46168.1 hypothetical protein CKM354_000930600 [Cercospora kikuchii]
MSSAKCDEILGRNAGHTIVKGPLSPFRRSATLLFSKSPTTPPPAYDQVVKRGDTFAASQARPLQSKYSHKFKPSLDAPPESWEPRSLKSHKSENFLNSYASSPRYRRDSADLNSHISDNAAQRLPYVPEKDVPPPLIIEKKSLSLQKSEKPNPYVVELEAPMCSPKTQSFVPIRIPTKIHPAFRTSEDDASTSSAPSTPENDHPLFRIPDYQKPQVAKPQIAELEAPIDFARDKRIHIPSRYSVDSSPSLYSPPLSAPHDIRNYPFRLSIDSAPSVYSVPSTYSPTTPQWIPDDEKIVISEPELQDRQVQTREVTVPEQIPSPTQRMGLLQPPRKRKVYEVRFVGEFATNQMEILKNGRVVKFVQIKCSFFGTPLVLVHAGNTHNAPIVAACKFKQIRSGFYVRAGPMDSTPYQKWPQVKWNSWNEKDYLFDFQHRRLCWRSAADGILDCTNAGDHHLIDLDTGVVLAAYHKDRTWFAFKPFAKIEFYAGVEEELEVLSLAIVMGIEERRKRAIEANAAGNRGS